MTREPTDQSSAENPGRDSIAELLRRVGPRQPPPAEMKKAVRASVHAAWQATLASQRRRARNRWLALAAAVLLGVGGLYILQEVADIQPAPFATVAKLAGSVSVARDGAADWRPLAATELLRVGDRVRTAAASGLAVTLAHGGSLRLAAGSEATIREVALVALQRGAIYLDTRDGRSLATLLLETPFGSVSHLGTQYQVELEGATVRISVREGRVELQRAEATHRVSAGELLAVGSDGIVDQRRISTYGVRWAWADELASAFDIDDKTLASFLEWVARETGRRLVFEDTASEQAANEIVLRGSIRELSPEAALEAVLATTRLRRVAGAPGELVIGLRSGGD